MWRAIWARIMLLWFGRSIGLTAEERARDLDRMRRDHPEMFKGDR